MTRAIVIEDEKLASRYLVSRLSELAPDIEVEAVLTNVAASISYLSENAAVDLIFSDVQLKDGLSFSIFKKVPLSTPVIFITAYDKFIVSAFEHNGIDYLLKPVSDEDLLKAITKYRRLRKHFSAGNPQTRDAVLQQSGGKKQMRIIVKRGKEHVFLLPDDVVLFYTENKSVYIIDKTGKKFPADKSLTDLEEELDKNVFFRANRQYLVNINYVRGYKVYERVKLQLELTIALNHCIVISQETAPVFKKWICAA